MSIWNERRCHVKRAGPAVASRSSTCEPQSESLYQESEKEARPRSMNWASAPSRAYPGPKTVSCDQHWLRKSQYRAITAALFCRHAAETQVGQGFTLPSRPICCSMRCGSGLSRFHAFHYSFIWSSVSSFT